MAVDKNKIIAEATKLVQKGAYDKAIKQYERILAEDAKDVRVLLKVGELYQKKGDDRMAADAFKRVAETYADQGFFLKSVAVYKQVMKLDAEDIRVNAEDPVTFAPSPGRITGYHQPGGYGVRVDTMAYEQYKVQPYYDSLVAKLIVTGATREIALQRMMRALNEYVIEGIKTNIAFHKRVLVDPRFVAGKYDTRIVDQILNPPAVPEVPPKAP